MVTLINSEGGTEEGIYTASLEMAVITRRFRWKRGKGRNTQYAVGKRPGPGWRGQLHILALVRGADGNWHGPVAVTYTGLAGSSFQEAYRQFREAAETVVGEGTPLWQFFGTYQAGGTEMVGSEAKSPITTVVCDCDGGFDPEAQYIGDEMAQEVESLAEQVRAWRDAWRNAGNGDGGEGDTPTPKPKPKDPSAPASKAQWGLIRRLLTELGYEGEERQNKVLRKKGFDPANLTMGQASELIGRLQKAGGPGVEQEAVEIPEPAAPVVDGQFTQSSAGQAYRPDFLPGNLCGPERTA